MLLTALANWKQQLQFKLQEPLHQRRRRKKRASSPSGELLEDRTLLSSVSGVVFQDLNADQSQDAGEMGLAGVTVYLDANDNGMLDPGEISQNSDSNGNYLFENLQAGEYVVRQVVPEDLRQTTRGNDAGTYYGSAYIVGSGGQMNFVSIDGATGQVNRIGSTLSVQIQGLVRTNDGRFFGLNGFNSDTIYEINPTTGALTSLGQTGYEMTFGLAYDAETDTIYGIGKPTANDTVNRLLIVDRTDGSVTPVGPGTTGMTGTSGLTFDPVNRQIIAFDNGDDEFYAFDTNGNATRISDLSGLTFYSLAYNAQGFVYQQIGVTNNNNQNLVGIDPVTGQQHLELTLSEATPMESLEWVGDPSLYRVNLTDGQSVSGLNFGNVELGGTLQGTKFEDLNGNGVRDANENPLQGVTVYLDLNHNGMLDQGPAGIEPDNFTSGTNVSRVVPGVTLEATFQGDTPRDVESVRSVTSPNLPSTGDQTFAPVGLGPLWSAANWQLEITFDSDVDFVSIDVIGASLNADARLDVYDANGNYLSTDRTVGLNIGESETLSVMRSGIRRAVVTSASATASIALDNLHFSGTGPAEPFRLTDENGEYVFSDLAAGDYVVREVVPEGYTPTFPAATDPRLFLMNYLETPDMIFEVDPNTGTVLNQFNAPTNADTGGHGMAFDGQTLYFVDYTNDTLFELNPEDGGILDSTQLPAGNYDGVATLDGLVYVLDFNLDDLLVFDPATDTVLRTLDLNAVNPGFDFLGALGELPETGELIVTTVTDDVLIINPMTGQSTGSFQHNGGGDFGVTSLNGEIYLGFSGSPQIRVFDRDGNLLRTIQTTYPIYSLAGDSGSEAVHRVSLHAGETISDLDFGNQPEVGELHGTKFEDLNGNGTQDAGERGLSGVTIYLDANHNEMFDEGELSTQTDANGDYVFSNLPTGTYLVREVVPEGYVQTSPGAQEDFYYAVTRSTRELLRINAVTGEVTHIGPLNISTDLQGMIVTNSGELFAISGSGSNDTFWSINPNTGQATPIGPTGVEVGFGLAYDSATDTIYGIGRLPDGTNGLLTYDRTTGQREFRSTTGFQGLTGTSGVAFDSEHNRILVYNFSDGAIYSFNPDGTGEILSHTQGGLGVNASFVDCELVIARFPSSTQTQLLAINPDTGAIRNLRTLNESFVAEALEFVDLPSFAHEVTLESGEVIEGLDFGNQPARGDLSGIKFEDLNGNSLQDPGERGLGGVTVYLDTNNNGTLDEGETSTVTDGNGHYEFLSLLAGDYVVREVVPDGYVQTSPAAQPSRLFAMNVFASPDQILELDPNTGATLNQFNAPTNTSTSAHGLAFDGESLYFVDALNDRLFELNPDDGTVLGFVQLPSGSYDGVAVLEGLVYVLNTGSNDVLVVNPETQAIINTLDLNAVNPGVTFQAGLGEIPSTGKLIASTTTNQVVLIDPQTGEITSSFLHNGGFDAGLTSLNGEIYVGFTSSPEIRVFSQTGSLIRVIDTTFPAYSLAGSDAVPPAYQVTLLPGDSLTGLDFGNQPAFGELRGTKFDDLDGDGIREANEPGMAGVTVYLDLNQNGIFDFGGTAEPDDFPPTTDLTNAFEGVTLSVANSLNQTTTLKVRSNADQYSSTGANTFFEEGIPFWTSGLRFRAEFDQPVGEVHLDFISSSTSGQVGTLLAFDAAGNLLETYTTSSLVSGNVETMTITRSTADIAYITAYTLSGSFGRLDNLRFGNPEPFTRTDANGDYVFEELAIGSYIVREVVPAGFRQTAPGPQGDFYFAIDQPRDQLVRIDATTGEVTVIGPHNAGTDLHGLAFTNSGELYAISGSGIDRLWKLDPTTGQATLIGNTGRNVGFGLAYDAKTDTIYGVGTHDDGRIGLVTYNRLTGEATPVGSGVTTLTATSGVAFDRLNNRIIAFDNSDDEFYAFTPDGTATLLATASPAIQSFGMTYNGADLILSRSYDGFGRNFVAINPDTGASTVILTTSQVVGTDALEFVDVEPFAHLVTLAAGEVIEGLDFGNTAIPAELRGVKFEDIDGDGIRDENESPLEGVTIYLDANDNGQLDMGEASTQTNADGEYVFVVPAGTYTVREIVPDGFHATTPQGRLFATDTFESPDRIVELDPNTGAIIHSFATPIPNGSTFNGLAFDGHVLYVLNNSDDILYELNPDTGAVLDATHLPSKNYTGLAVLEGLVYAIDLSSDHVVVFDPDTKTVLREIDLRAQNPNLFFDNSLAELPSSGELLVSTSRTIVFVDPTTGTAIRQFPLVQGFGPTGLTSIHNEIYVDFSNDTIDVYDLNGNLLRTITTVDVNPFALASSEGGEAVYRVSVANAEVRNGLDFGNQQIAGSLSGTEFEDRNENGLRDQDEPPLVGITIYLDANNNGVLNAGERTTTTDDNGNYTFDNLMPGEYFVREILSPGFRATTPAGRLFATNTFASPDEIVEISPEDGSVIRRLIPTVPSGSIFNGIAFDGQTIYFADSINHTLFELDPDNGALKGSTVLPTGTYSGLAVLDGLVYAFRGGFSEAQIVDPNTHSIVGQLDLRAANPTVIFNDGFGELPSTGELIAMSSTAVYLLDPATGRANSSFALASGFSPRGVTSINGEIFVGFTNDTVQVYDRAGTLLRTLTTVNVDPFGLGGNDSGTAPLRVQFQTGQHVTGLDIGNFQFNYPPVADAGGPYTIAEGSSLLLDASATFDPDGDVLTYAWDLDNDGQYDDATGAAPIISWDELVALGLGDDGTFTVGVEVRDGIFTDTATSTLEITNVAPNITNLSLDQTPIDENGVVTLTGSFEDPGTLDTHTVTIDWRDGNSSTIEFTDGERVFSMSHQYLDDNPTGTPSDEYMILVSVHDDDTGEGTETIGVQVNNLVPEITSLTTTAAEVGSQDPGDTVEINATFTDVGTLDTHTASIDWGDGTSSTADITQGSGNGSLAGTHTYLTGGVFEITVTLRDDDTGTATATTFAFITGVRITDAGELQIVGSSDSDHISVNQQGNGSIKIHGEFLNAQGNQVTLPIGNLQSILVFLGNGDDDFSIAGDIDYPLLVVGSAGDDQIQAARGRSILIGGSGADQLQGGKDQDILIAGGTAFDNSPKALSELLAEWASNRTLEERVGNLFNGSGTASRLNGDAFLTVGVRGTITDDGDEDQLAGGQDTDWFFEPPADQAHDLRDELFANDLDSLLSA